WRRRGQVHRADHGRRPRSRAGGGKGAGRVTARRVIPWLALLAILVVALVVGTHGKSGRLTVDQRVHRVADELRCPTCRSQSMADSDAAAAKAGRLEIRRRVLAGESDAEIRA